MAYLPGMGAPQPNWLGMLGQNFQQFKTPSAMMPIMGMLSALQPSREPKNYGLAVATGGLQGLLQGQQYDQEMQRQEQLTALRELQMQQARAQMARDQQEQERERQLMAAMGSAPGQAMLASGDPQKMVQAFGGMLSPEQTLQMAMMRPEGPEPYTLGPGQVRYDEQNNPIAVAPFKPQGPDKPTSLMQNLAEAGLTPGTPEYQAAMLQAINRPQNQINMGQAPSGYYWKDPANPAAGLTALPGGPAEKEQKAAERNVNMLEDSVDRYEKLLDKTGAEIIPGKEQSELSTAYTDVMMQLKELWNLGVLQGADFEIMARAITDPTSFRGKAIELFGGVDALKGQLDVIRQKMKAAKGSAGMLSGKGDMMEPGMLKRETNRSDADILKQYGLE